jgi:hypothetical protein
MTDTLSGLVWSKGANAPGPVTCGSGTGKTWQVALDYVQCLNTNIYLGYNDWRLPNLNELASLTNKGLANSATWLIVQGFTNVMSDNNYWSSSSYAPSANYAWFVNLVNGGEYNSAKTYVNYVWPVRN